MIYHSSQNTFQADKRCIMAFIDGQSFKSTDYNYIYPRNDLFGKTYAVSGSLIDTSIDLRKLPAASFLLMFALKLDESKLPIIDKTLDECKHPEWMIDKPAFAKINLIKQGTTNLDGLLDICLECGKCKDGVHRRLIVKQYFKNTTKINRTVSTCSFKENQFLSKTDVLFISVDTAISIMSVWVNDERIADIPLDYVATSTNKFNYPMSEKRECSCATIGDKNEALYLKSAVMFNKNIDPMTYSALRRAAVLS